MATVTLQSLKSTFWRYQNQHFSSTATGGAANYVQDTSIINCVSEVWPYGIKDTVVRMTSGAASGDLRQVANIDEVHGNIYVNRAFSANPANTDTYELWGNSIYSGQRLTDLFNDTCVRLRPPTQDQLTIVSNQRIYDISQYVLYPDDVIEVWLRLIDPANLVPYTPMVMQWWRVYALSGATSGGTSQTILEIRPALTATNTIQLWLEHAQSLPTFANDASTIDAIYAPWLAWEAILTHCERMMDNVTVDTKPWEVRRARAIKNLSSLRQRFIPLRPIRIRPEVPL